MDNNTIKFLTLKNDVGERLDVILTRKLSDLTRSNIKKMDCIMWCARKDLNPQPSDPKSDALSS